MKLMRSNRSSIGVRFIALTARRQNEGGIGVGEDARVRVHPMLRKSETR